MLTYVESGERAILEAFRMSFSYIALIFCNNFIINYDECYLISLAAGLPCDWN